MALGGRYAELYAIQRSAFVEDDEVGKDEVVVEAELGSPPTQADSSTV